MLTRGFYSALTLVELLVVIAVLTVLIGVVAPSLDNWSCRQEVRNDFDELNGFLETLRDNAVSRNRTMMATVTRGGINANIVSQMSPDEGEKRACNIASFRNIGIDAKIFATDGSNLALFTRTNVCFNADGTATPASYTITRQCDDDNFQFRNQIFGITGFIEKLKLNVATLQWDEL